MADELRLQRMAAPFTDDHPTKPIDVPTVDIGQMAHGKTAEASRKIDAACRGFGFFYAVNHGIDLAALERVTADFHRGIPPEEKRRIAIRAYNPASTRSRSGYYMAIPGRKANESFCYLSPVLEEDHPRIAGKFPLYEINSWPRDEHLKGWKTYYEVFYRQIFALAAQILRGFALALGKPETFFEQYLRLDDTLSAVSLIHYPYLDPYPPLRIASDGTRLNFEDHQDVGVITILYQTPVPNLQVLTETGYRDIPPRGDAFLVNCGTYMSHITNGYYPAPVHRVVHVNRERLSIPFFVSFGYEDVIEPFSSPASETAQRNTAVRYGDYLAQGLSDLILSNGQT